MDRKTPVAFLTAASVCCGSSFLFAASDIDPPPPVRMVAIPTTGADKPAATHWSAPVKNLPVLKTAPIDYNFGSSDYPTSEILKPGQGAVEGSVRSESAEPSTSVAAAPLERTPVAAPRRGNDGKETWAKRTATRSAVGTGVETYPNAPPTFVDTAAESTASTSILGADVVVAPAPIPPAQLSTPLTATIATDVQAHPTRIPRARTEASWKETTTPLALVSAGRAPVSMQSTEWGLDAVTGKSLQNPGSTAPNALEFNVNVAIDCLRILGGSPIEADREQALAMLSRMRGWQQYRPIYQTLRRVALTEYNTRMRATAVQMLGAATSDHHLVADVLRLSAQYDGEPSIQAYAQRLLERLASMPAENFAR